MLMTPAFWTRIVILVDAHPTPLSMIKSQIAWTRDLPLDVTITRRVALRTLDSGDQHEKARVASVVAIITPQLCRCQKLRVDASLSSSLPSFSSSFHGDAPLLEELLLECDVDDGGFEAAIVPPGTQKTEQFQCPALRKLAIDGRNFYNACEEGNWTSFPAVTDLAISRFTRDESFPFLNLSSTLSRMECLTDLRLTDLMLDPPEEEDLDSMFIPMLSSLVCEDIDDVKTIECLDECFNTIFHLTLTRCATATGTVTYDVDMLTLKEISGDVDDFLRSWFGSHLHLDSCPGFNDIVLERMCLPENRFIVSLITFLEISNCLAFSVPALKRFVETREYPGSGECPTLKTMRISGNSPYFSLEERLWFEEHLIDFTFTPVTE